MAKKPGLGKGLEALIPQMEEEKVKEGSISVPINQIIPNPRQPRFLMDDSELKELSDSIAEHGIIQPLIVTYDELNDQYTLIAGERRLRAAKLAKLEAVPVIIKQVTDQQRLEIALIENIQRADLTPLETAEAYQQLHTNFGLSHEEIAKRVGKNRVTVTNNLRLLKLPEKIQKELAEANISEGHARALLMLTSEKAQTAALNTILTQGLNVRQTEELVRKLSGQKVVKKIEKTPPNPDLIALEDQLRTRLGTKVNLNHGKKGNGSITIHYYSDEELETIINHLLRQ